MNVRRWRFCGALAALLLTILTMSGAPVAAAPPAQQSSVSFISEPGDPVGNGAARWFHTGRDAVTVSGSRWVIEITATQENAPLLQITLDVTADDPVGRYDYAVRYPTNVGTSHPGMSVSMDGHACNELDGNFRVYDLEFGDDDVVDSLHASFIQKCRGAAGSAYGEIYYNSETATSFEASASQLRLPQRYVDTQGRMTPVWVRNTGVTSLDVGAVILPEEGAWGYRFDADSFVLGTDSCSGTVLQPGDECAVTVAFRPKRPGPLYAEMQLPLGDETHRVGMYAEGLLGQTAMKIFSEPGDYIGNGVDFPVYNVDNATFTAAVNRDAVVVAVEQGWDGWRMEFNAAPGERISTGVYENATRWPFNEAGPGFDFVGYGRGCNRLSARFKVYEVAYSPEGDLERLNATFEQHCEMSEPALFGSVAWRSTQPLNPLPFVDTTPPPAVDDFTVVGRRDNALLSWRARERGTKTVVRYAEGAVAPASPRAGRSAYRGAGNTTTITTLSPRNRYTFAAFSVDAAGNVSRRRVATIRPTRLEADLAPVTAGQTVPGDVQGVLETSRGPVAGRTVRVLRRPAGGEWSRVAASQTTRSGSYSGEILRRQKTYVRVRFNGARSLWGSKRDAGVLLVSN